MSNTPARQSRSDIEAAQTPGGNTPPTPTDTNPAAFTVSAANTRPAASQADAGGATTTPLRYLAETGSGQEGTELTDQTSETAALLIAPTTRSQPSGAALAPPRPSHTEPSALFTAWESYQAQTDQAVTGARLKEQMGRAEMRVELHTEDLGPMAVHATVRDGEVGAMIRVESHEAQALLSSELPALKRALTDQNLQVNNVVVFQGSAADSSGGGKDSHASSEEFPRLESHSSLGRADRMAASAAGGPESMDVEMPSMRLSVRA